MVTNYSTDSVKMYLHSIGQYPLLDKAEEKVLSKAIQTGQAAATRLEQNPQLPQTTKDSLNKEVDDGKRAAQKLYLSNLRLVVSIARKLVPSNTHLLDFIQDGNIGLMQAVNKFDHSRDIKFSTYATWWVRQAIQHGHAHNTALVRVPPAAQISLNNLLQIMRDAENNPGAAPTYAQMAAETRMPESKVALLLRNTIPPVSLEGPTQGSESGPLLGDSFPAEGTTAHNATQNGLRDSLIQMITRETSHRHGQVIMRYFGLHGQDPQSLNEISAAMGISPSAARRNLHIGLNQLRAATQKWGKEEVLAALS